MRETEEMRVAYRNVKVGDPPVFIQRFQNWAGELPEYCAFEWEEDPLDPPIEGDFWVCTREPGHELPHVAEGFNGVFAVCGDETE